MRYAAIRAYWTTRDLSHRTALAESKATRLALADHLFNPVLYLAKLVGVREISAYILLPDQLVEEDREFVLMLWVSALKTESYMLEAVCRGMTRAIRQVLKVKLRVSLVYGYAAADDTAMATEPVDVDALRVP